jgi:hypothetical protein
MIHFRKIPQIDYYDTPARPAYQLGDISLQSPKDNQFQENKVGVKYLA